MADKRAGPAKTRTAPKAAGSRGTAKAAGAGTSARTAKAKAAGAAKAKAAGPRDSIPKATAKKPRTTQDRDRTGNRSAKPAAARARKAPRIARPPVEAGSEIIVAAAKFATGVSDETSTAGREATLPDTYEHNHLTLLVRDPQTLFAHWDVSPSWADEMKARVGGRSLATAPFTLRLTPAGTGASQDFHVSRRARSTYITVTPGSTYAAEIGVTSAAGEFHLIARSAVVTLPPAAPSREARTPEVRRFSEARAIATERRRRRPAQDAGPRLPKRRTVGAAARGSLGSSPARIGAEPFGGASDVHRL